MCAWVDGSMLWMVKVRQFMSQAQHLVSAFLVDCTTASAGGPAQQSFRGDV